MLKLSTTILILAVVVCGAAPHVYAMNVPFKLGDLNLEGEVEANSLWKPYYSPSKKFSINYYDAPSLYPEQNITETVEKITMDTLPMYISVVLKGPFYTDTDIQLHAFQIMNRHLVDENRTILEDVHPVWTSNIDRGYSYILYDGYTYSSPQVMQIAFFDHDYYIYQIMLISSYSKNTLSEFEKTMNSIKLFG